MSEKRRMPLPYPDVDIAKVREYAERAVNATSLRVVAPTIPLGTSTLHNFVSGAAPHPRVRALLCEWYQRERGEDAGASAALDILAGYFPAHRRDRVKRSLLDVINGEYELTGRDVPSWVDRLREGYVNGDERIGESER